MIELWSAPEIHQYENGKWIKSEGSYVSSKLIPLYKASDVADLARRVLPWIESGVGHEEVDENKEGIQDGLALIAELTELAKGGG